VHLIEIFAVAGELFPLLLETAVRILESPAASL
jgi:hypothetical protein